MTTTPTAPKRPKKPTTAPTALIQTFTPQTEEGQNHPRTYTLPSGNIVTVH